MRNDEEGEAQDDQRSCNTQLPTEPSGQTTRKSGESFRRKACQSAPATCIEAAKTVRCADDEGERNCALIMAHGGLFVGSAVSPPHLQPKVGNAVGARGDVDDGAETLQGDCEGKRRCKHNWWPGPHEVPTVTAPHREERRRGQTSQSLGARLAPDQRRCEE